MKRFEFTSIIGFLILIIAVVLVPTVHSVLKGVSTFLGLILILISFRTKKEEST